MARIPAAANVPQVGGVSDPGLRVPNFGGDLGRGLEGLGRQIQVKARDIQQKKQRAEDLRFGADYERVVRERVAKTMLDFRGQEVETGFADRVNTAVTAATREELERLRQSGYSPSEEATARASVWATGLASTTFVTALTDEHNAKVIAAGESLVAGMDAMVNELQSAPSRAFLEGTLEGLQEKLDAAQGLLPPDKITKLGEEYRNFAYASYVRGLVQEKKTGEARSALMTDAANELLAPAEKARLLNVVSQEEEQRRREARAELRAQQGDAAREVSSILRDAWWTVEHGAQPNLRGIADVLPLLPPAMQETVRAQLTTINKVQERYSNFSTQPRAVRDSELARLTQQAEDNPTSREDLEVVRGLQRIHHNLSVREDAAVNRVDRAVKRAVSVITDPTSVGSTADRTELLAAVEALPAAMRPAGEAQINVLSAQEEVLRSFYLGSDAARATTLAQTRASLEEGGMTPEEQTFLDLLKDFDAERRETDARDATRTAVLAGDSPDVPPEFSLSEEYWEPMATLIVASVARSGEAAQNVPRPAVEGMKHILESGAVDEQQLLMDRIASLSDEPRRAVIRSLGRDLQSHHNVVMEFPRASQLILAAAKADTKGTPAIPREELVTLVGDAVGAAFSGHGGLYSDFLDTVGKVLAYRYVTKGVPADPVAAAEEVVQSIVSGRIVEVNDDRVLVSPDLAETPRHPTSALLRERLPLFEDTVTMDQVVVPLLRPGEAPPPPNATFLGVYRGDPQSPDGVEQIPWREFVSSRLRPDPVGPDVFTPMIDGSLGESYAMARYRVIDEQGGFRDMFFPAGLSLRKALELEPGKKITPPSDQTLDTSPEALGQASDDELIRLLETAIRRGATGAERDIILEIRKRRGGQ